MSATNRIITLAALTVLAGLNLAHPFLHAFEGGSLDVLLVHLNAFTVQALGARA